MRAENAPPMAAGGVDIIRDLRGNRGPRRPYQVVIDASRRQRPGAVPWWRLNAAANENSDA